MRQPCRQRLQDVLFGYGAAAEVSYVHCAIPTVPEGVCGGCGTIRPAVPPDFRLVERIDRLCHRPAARGSKTYYPGMGPPQRSRQCI